MGEKSSLQLGEPALRKAAFRSTRSWARESMTRERIVNKNDGERIPKMPPSLRKEAVGSSAIRTLEVHKAYDSRRRINWAHSYALFGNPSPLRNVQEPRVFAAACGSLPLVPSNEDEKHDHGNNCNDSR